jgi:hypothetical protein
VGVNSRDLSSYVRTNPQSATTKLVCKLEGKQVEILTQTHQQGFGELHERWDYQAVSPAAIQVQQSTAQVFNSLSLARKNLFHPIRKLPVIYPCHFI